jgi:hypothetical protein
MLLAVSKDFSIPIDYPRNLSPSCLKSTTANYHASTQSMKHWLVVLHVTATQNSGGTTSFQKMNFQFRHQGSSRYTGFILSQHLHFSSSSLKSNVSTLSQDGTPNFERISILSGMCLLFDNIVRGSIRTDGSLNIETLYYAKPTLHEME